MTPLPKTSAPAARALDSIGVTSLEDLTKNLRQEIAELHGMGPKALKILESSLRSHGLDWRR